MRIFIGNLRTPLKRPKRSSLTPASSSRTTGLLPRMSTTSTPEALRPKGNVLESDCHETRTPCFSKESFALCSAMESGRM